MSSLWVVLSAPLRVLMAFDRTRPEDAALLGAGSPYVPTGHGFVLEEAHPVQMTALARIRWVQGTTVLSSGALWTGVSSLASRTVLPLDLTVCSWH